MTAFNSGLVELDAHNVLRKVNKLIEEKEKELVYQQGFVASVDKKLGNERFVNNAPEQVVNNERKKKEDAGS